MNATAPERPVSGGIYRLPDPGVSYPWWCCQFCGCRISDAPRDGDCDCDPPGSGYPRYPKDVDYATRCTTCGAAVKVVNRRWEHAWPLPQGRGHLPAGMTSAVPLDGQLNSADGAAETEA